MKKIFSWISENILFLCTLVLISFIPLYPKLPLLDIKNTWVYVRVEDFLVLFAFFLWVSLLVKKKITLKTPLTIPILTFWIVGALATIHGVIVIFPEAANVFPNVAFLSYLRHLEYLGLFFIAFSSIRSKNSLKYVVWVVLATYPAVVFYGLGQKYLAFPAYLTMNEEFAKGIAIRLSPLSRVPSTFAGHYDLAAYLVLVMPILASLIFGFKNWAMKIILAGLLVLGFFLLFMTVSRISFLVLFISLFAVLYFYNKKYVLLSIPIIIISGIFILSFQPSLLSRFGSTIKEVNVLVDSRTGNAIGHVNYVSTKHFEGRVLNQRKIGENGEIATSNITEEEKERASPSSLIVFSKLPQEVPLVSDVNLSTGENLPQGTGYINLPLSPVSRKLSYFFYEKTQDESPASSEIYIFQGDFLLKKASAYDLSFTTRFQGEWPNALEAFKKNLLLGSGYGSVSLAVDNNYLRMLGEVGILGIVAFFSLFLISGIYVKRILPTIDSKLTRSFIIGFCGGIFGLFLNAIFIDVFEASKIAFLLWGITGAVMGTLLLYQNTKLDILRELKKIIISTPFVVFYIIVSASFLLLPMVGNFFVGDDFTWLRWASDCTDKCSSIIERFTDYFTSSGGFFYRPGTKIYFYLMDSAFWFNQVVYHTVSILAHSAVIALFFILAKKILNNLYLAIFASFLFLLMSGYSEMVFWIASTGHIFNAIFILASLLFFINWEEKKKEIFFILFLFSAFVSTLFHELGIVTPLFALLYKFYKDEKINPQKLISSLRYFVLFTPSVFYLLLRIFSHSHWFSGDYNYNLMKFPLNAAGNIIGYIFLTLLGSNSLTIYEAGRNLLRENIFAAMMLLTGVIIFAFFALSSLSKYFEREEKKIILFGFSFFIIALIPFLGLGNITSRYSYLACFGLIFILVICLRKLYRYLQIYGKEIAVGIFFLFVAIFSLWHIIQVQQAHRDWEGAGKQVNNFFTSIDALYSNHWATEPVELHFVNVPIKSGDAWIFPVGLEDAVWIAFKNPNIKIFKHATKEEAFDQTVSSRNQPIFVFQDDGGLKEVFKLTPVPSKNLQTR